MINVQPDYVNRELPLFTTILRSVLYSWHPFPRYIGDIAVTTRRRIHTEQGEMDVSLWMAE